MTSTKTSPYRTLYGVWILGDLLSSAYGTAPPFTVGRDGGLELPCSEALWQARTEAEWTEARLAEAGRGGGVSMAVRDACTLIADCNNDREPPPVSTTAAMTWSPFAIVCIMHIFSTGLWHLSHGPLSSVTTTLRPAVAHTLRVPNLTSRHGAEPSLLATGRRCHDLIRAYSERIEEQEDGTLRRSTKDARWQLANAADVLRVCYARTAPTLVKLDCDTLLRGGDEDVRVAIREHVAAPLERSAEFTLAAAVAYEGLCVPLRYGAQLYRRTGALSGSLESIISGWDNGEFYYSVGFVRAFLSTGRMLTVSTPFQALLVSKWAQVVSAAWVLGMALDNEELELLESISDMLRQGEPEPDESRSLPARLLRYWAGFYEDTWVWGGKSGRRISLPTCTHARSCLIHRYLLDNFLARTMLTEGYKFQSRREWQSSSISLRARTSPAIQPGVVGDQRGGPSNVKVGRLGSLMRPVGDIRAPVCFRVGTPCQCLPCRDQRSLWWLGGDIQIAGGRVGMDKLHVCCNFGYHEVKILRSIFVHICFLEQVQCRLPKPRRNS